MKVHRINKGATVGLTAAAVLLALPFAAVAEDDDAAPAGSSVSIGINPGQAKAAGISSSDGAPPLTLRTSTQDWEFGFHGYLRAPLTMSFDKHDVTTYPKNANGVPNMTADSTTSKDWRINMSPTIVDGVYTDWKYTSSLGGPWAEMVFSYGNAIAVGNVSVATYNITDSSWRKLQSQLGINQAFVTLNFPRAFKSRGGLVWNVGVFDNRYGSAGRYDAGRYDTYIIGRTHTAGETLTAKIDLTDKMVLMLEHGFGAKSDVLGSNSQALIKQGLTWEDAAALSWVPYSGQEGQWPAMVNHAHAGLVLHTFKWFKELQINGHFMHAFTNKADPSTTREWPYKERDGKMIIAGAEIKFNGAAFGDLYLGFSSMKTDGLNRMSDAIELLHSQGGWCLLKNFYGEQLLIDTTATANDPATSRDNKPNPGTGRINTLAWQYQLSMSRLLWFLQGKEFWGQGPDLTVTSWGMVNFIDPANDLEPYLQRWAKKKMKFGFETMYTPLKYFGFGLRMDRVIPDMDYDIADTATNAGTNSSYAPFTVLSPKLQFRTAFVTHEEVNIQYSHYFWEKTGLTEAQYRSEVRAENPYEGQPADRNALMISVNMWW